MMVRDGPSILSPNENTSAQSLLPVATYHYPVHIPIPSPSHTNQTTPDVLIQLSLHYQRSQEFTKLARQHYFLFCECAYKYWCDCYDDEALVRVRDGTMKEPRNAQWKSM